jgi:hypothetical protein
MRRLPEDRPEAAAEVRRRDVGHRGHGGHIEGFRIGAVHGVPSAQEAAVQVLGFQAHGSNATLSGTDGDGLPRMASDAARTVRRLAILAVLVALVAGACGADARSAPPPAGPSSTAVAPTLSADPGRSPGPATASPLPTPTSPTWRQVTVDGPSPAGREDHTWTADPATGSIWLFGGRDGGTVFGDLWRYDPAGSAWSRVEPEGPAPDGRFGHTGTWVPGKGLVIWSGQAGSRFFADLWAFDPESNRWAELPARGAVPPARYGSCAALAPDGRLWVSHGFTQDAGRFSDTVAYDFGAGTWADTTAEGPVIRCLHDCLFTPDGAFLLYAGQTTGAPAIGDLWIRPADAGWSPGPAAEPVPPPRQLYGLASRASAAYVFGGGGADGTKLGDLWRLDLESLTWQALQPTGVAPAARSGSAMAAHAGSGAILMFGGTDGAAGLADVWQLTAP